MIAEPVIKAFASVTLCMELKTVHVIRALKNVQSPEKRFVMVSVTVRAVNANVLKNIPVNVVNTAHHVRKCAKLTTIVSFL